MDQHYSRILCSCGECSTMKYRCCQEDEHVKAKTNKRCITLSERFQKLCIDKDVLLISIMTNSDESLPHPVPNNLFSKAAYKQFGYWMYGVHGIINITPCCVVKAIQKKFSNQENIIGHHQATGKVAEEEQGHPDAADTDTEASANMLDKKHQHFFKVFMVIAEKGGELFRKALELYTEDACKGNSFREFLKKAEAYKKNVCPGFIRKNLWPEMIERVPENLDSLDITCCSALLNTKGISVLKKDEKDEKVRKYHDSLKNRLNEIKDFRNELCHDADIRFTDEVFDQKFDKIRKLFGKIARIEPRLNIPDYKLLSYKNIQFQIDACAEVKAVMKEVALLEKHTVQVECRQETHTEEHERRLKETADSIKNIETNIEKMDLIRASTLEASRNIADEELQNFEKVYNFTVEKGAKLFRKALELYTDVACKGKSFREFLKKAEVHKRNVRPDFVREILWPEKKGGPTEIKNFGGLGLACCSALLNTKGISVLNKDEKDEKVKEEHEALKNKLNELKDFRNVLCLETDKHYSNEVFNRKFDEIRRLFGQIANLEPRLSIPD